MLTTVLLLVLHNATVINGTGAPSMRNVDVVIRDGRIASVGRPCNHGRAQVIDATGKYVLPGFIDMQAHLLEHGRDAKGQIPARIDWDLVRLSLQLYLKHGVTTVRDPGSETEAGVTLRKMLREGAISRPRLFTAGRIINASPFNPEPFKPVRTAAEVRREIRWQAAAGVDFIKVYASTPPDLVAAAIDEAHKHRLRVIGHLGATTWKQAAELGIDFICHGAPWTGEFLPEVAREGHDGSLFGRVYWLEHLKLDYPAVRDTINALARRGVVVDPTLIAMHTKFFGDQPRWLENPDNTLLPSELIAGWKAGSFTRDWTTEQYAAARPVWPKMLALTRAMFDAGVPLIVGTDAPTAWIVPGAGFHDELTFLRDAGIPPLSILQMATWNAAKALGGEQEFGSIKPGLRADLVILDANPLEKIENTRRIHAVIQGGRVVSGLERQQ